MNRLKNIFVCLGVLAAGRSHAETVYWSDNFETNAGSRWTTNSVWQIGAPSFGPGSAYSGIKCATTGLKTIAPANVDARLVCTNYNGTNWLAIPAANQFPRLRFWQWYDFVNAGGMVEILQAGTTNWLAISATNISVGATANYSSGVWSRPAIDLSPFAGQNVQIAFRFFSGGNGWGSDPGSYVDDVAVVTNAPVFNNPESFEGGLGDWSVTAGTWEVGKPTVGPATNAVGFRAHSGTNCAGTVLAGNYGWNMDTRLVSPQFAVPASGSPVLHYWQWYSFVNAGGFVEINTGITNTTATTNITVTTNLVYAGLNTNVYQLVGAAIADYANPLYWNPTIGGWTNATKAMGNVDDIVFKAGYFFEAGSAPLISVGNQNDDYSLNGVLPVPRTAAATNYLAWQGETWTSPSDGNDTPVGYFGTNYTYTYSTNTAVTFTQNSWRSLSPTNISVGSAAIANGGWTQANLDLSAYAGQTVQVAFRFFSGGSGWGNAPGWYLDDIGLAALPILLVPTNSVMVTAGTILTLTNYATLNPTNLTPTFKLIAGPTNNATLNATNGVLTWATPAAQPPGLYTNVIKVTDTDGLSATNTFVVTVLPVSPSLTLAGNVRALTNGFPFSFQSLSNTTWRIDASTNLVTWLPVFTNTTGTNGVFRFTDLLATNFPWRYYRAVFP
jgi:hypothetical protein